jgi:hypothetical protein
MNTHHLVADKYWVPAATEAALQTAFRLLRCPGLFCGISNYLDYYRSKPNVLLSGWTRIYQSFVSSEELAYGVWHTVGSVRQQCYVSNQRSRCHWFAMQNVKLLQKKVLVALRTTVARHLVKT